MTARGEPGLEVQGPGLKRHLPGLLAAAIIHVLALPLGPHPRGAGCRGRLQVGPGMQRGEPLLRCLQIGTQKATPDTSQMVPLRVTGPNQAACPPWPHFVPREQAALGWPRPDSRPLA